MHAATLISIEQIDLTPGATPDSAPKKGALSDLVRDAINSGQVVLVAQTHTETQTAIAREVLHASVGDYRDGAST